MLFNKDYLKNFLHDEIISLGFDEDSVDNAIDALCESVDESYPKFVEGLNEKDRFKTKFAAHSLKGTFGNFNNKDFAQLTKLFKEIELTLHNDEHFPNIDALFSEVKEIISKWSSL